MEENRRFYVGGSSVKQCEEMEEADMLMLNLQYLYYLVYTGAM